MTPLQQEDNYRRRMLGSPQFKHFGVEPQWRPGEGDIEGFVHDEVVRQYHDPADWDDGGRRIQWMLNAWDYARSRAWEGPPTLHDVEMIGAHIEPGYNRRGFRADPVHIGRSQGAPVRLLQLMMEALVARASTVSARTGREGPHPGEYRAYWQWNIFSDSDILYNVVRTMQRIITADDWYLAFEAIHPFRDGNGRTGKVLHNWLLGTLEDPVLVDDYFGGGNP